MEDIIKFGQLYDFYGELLTEHQKEVYEDLVYNDLSISEIAESYGISRQGAHDLVKRINNILCNYESKPIRKRNSCWVSFEVLINGV